MTPPRLALALVTAIVAAGGGWPAAHAAARVPDRNEPRTARYLEGIRSSPPKLRAFLAAFPKGADLHNHLSGAVPTETLIALAIDDGLCIDAATMTAQFKPPPAPAPVGALLPEPPACPAGQRPAADAQTDSAFNTQLLQAWSMEGFVPGAESGHDHFFATFGKFGAATERKGDLLAAVAKINAEQKVLYLETLASRQSAPLKDLVKRVRYGPDFEVMRQELEAKGMATVVKGASAETDGDKDRFDALLGCKTPKPQPGCALEIRYDYQVGRATDPLTVFAGLLLGFELQRSDHRYVGVNLVQPEDAPIALRDYTLHMQMIGYLRNVYRGAHVTLHAGELVPGLVGPEDLASHIRQAVEIAGAERIGHGVDLVHEAGYRGLLRTMATRHVLVEAPLTSNAQILGVSGPAHPFGVYRAAGVPVALATDDPGVSRIDITHEYEFATRTYRLRYRDLKTLTRASLEHAFLPGRSLWRATDDYRRAAPCARDRPGSGLRSASCRRLLRGSTKASLQWALETRLRAFERRMAARRR